MLQSFTEILGSPYVNEECIIRIGRLGASIRRLPETVYTELPVISVQQE